MRGGREVQKEGTYVWLIHVDVWQKPTQYCNYLSIKNKLKNKTNKKYDEFYIKFLTSAVQSEGLNIQTDNSQTICKDRTLIWNMQHLAQEASLLNCLQVRLHEIRMFSSNWSRKLNNNAYNDQPKVATPCLTVDSFPNAYSYFQCRTYCACILRCFSHV